MSTVSKREQIDQSIDSIFRLLVDIARSPDSYLQNEQVLNALKSQGAYAPWIWSSQYAMKTSRSSLSA